MEKSIGGISNIDEIIFAPKQSKIQIPVCDKTIISELSEDFTLPDYLPEIRRLLKITPRIPIASKYVSSALAEFSGNVNWSVLYVTGDGSLANANLFSPFEVSAEYDNDSKADIDSVFEAFDEITADNVVGRVTAPRKLSIRCRLSHLIRAYGDRSTDTEVYTDTPDDTIKRLTHTVPACRLKIGVDDTVEIEEMIPMSEGHRAVSCDGTVTITDVAHSNDGVRCHGNANLKFLISKENGEPFITERKVPFSAHVPLELDEDGWNCRGYGKISDISIEQNENDTLCRMHISVSAEAQKNIPTQYIADIFSTARNGESVIEEYPVSYSLVLGSFNFAHDGSAEVDGLPENAQAVDANAVAVPEAVILENDRYVLSGKCKYNVLYMSDGEYSVRETEFPFRCELSSGTEKPKSFVASVNVNSCRVRKEGENMAFGADMTASVRVLGETFIQAVSEASFNDAFEIERTAAFTIAYPADSETLWDVAKRYAVDPANLAASNGIKVADFDSKDSLNEIKYLIV